MTLDDRSLREHLDRRAESGVQDPDSLAEAVMARVATVETGPWWRRLRVGTPSLGIAAAAIVVIVVAIAVLPPRLAPGPGPGASPTSPQPTEATGYPVDHPLSGQELDELLGPDPSLRQSIVVVADVELVGRPIICDSSYCPDLEVRLPSRTITVHNWDGPEIQAPYALRVKLDGSLDLLDHVRTGPDGLAWTLPQLTAELANLRGPGVLPARSLYLVDAWRAVSTAAYRCRLIVAQTDPDFDCGGGVAWLVPDQASIPSEFNSAPPGSLRVPNVTGFRLRSDALRQHGYWLVDPFVPQDEAACFLCPPAGAADLIGRILTLEELGVTLPTPQPRSTSGEPTQAPTVSQLATVEIEFSTGSMALDGFETGDVTVSIGFTGPVQPDLGADPSLAPLIYLERDTGDTGDPLDPHIAQIVRAMDPTQVAGRWTATFRLTSGDRGTWRVGGIVASDIEGNEVDIGPAIRDSSPTLEVIGTRAPHLTMERKPTPVPTDIEVTLQIFGSVTDEDTGDPLGDVIVTIGQGDACAPGGTGTTVITDPNGSYNHVIPEADYSVVCAWISGEPGVYPSFAADGPIALFGAVFADPATP